MDTPLIVLAVAGTLLLGLLARALMYRPRKGRFRVLRRDPRRFTFRTDFGEFTIDRPNGSLTFATRKLRQRIDLAQVRRLDYRYREKEALVDELLSGWDIWDLAKRYRDVVGWFEISAVLASGKRVPLYAVGQYDPREPLSGWAFRLERAMLARLGLLTDVEDRSRSVLAQLQEAFASAGRPLNLL